VTDSYVLADFADYLACQQRVYVLWGYPEAWTLAASHNISSMSHFSKG
jgi:glucan phosphorylase